MRITVERIATQAEEDLREKNPSFDMTNAEHKLVDGLTNSMLPALQEIEDKREFLLHQVRVAQAIQADIKKRRLEIEEACRLKKISSESALQAFDEKEIMELRKYQITEMVLMRFADSFEPLAVPMSQSKDPQQTRLEKVKDLLNTALIRIGWRK